MSDFAKLKVAEIREAVLNKDPNFIDRDVVGKSAWVKVAQDMGLTPEDINSTPEFVVGIDPADGEDKTAFSMQEIFQEAEFEEDTMPEPTEVKEEKTDGSVPSYTDVGWHEYVMSQFKESELDRGYPKVEGMRRIAELLLGEVVFSGAVDYRSTMPIEGSDPGRSVVNYEIRIAWKNGVEPFVAVDGFASYTIRTFRGLASCYPGNVKGSVFIVFPESIAETRAEARALRKALGLKVVAAEEFGDVEVNDTIVTSNKIQEQQIFYIKNKTEDNEINLEDLLNEFGVARLEETDRETGASIISKINKLMKENK
jgi:hypothetical protein